MDSVVNDRVFEGDELEIKIVGGKWIPEEQDGPSSRRQDETDEWLRIQNSLQHSYQLLLPSAPSFLVVVGLGLG